MFLKWKLVNRMGRKILDIYEKYNIMPGLQEHMLRVASVAKIVCENYAGKTNEEEIITACLLHDMGNVIKSDLVSFPEFLGGKEIDYWQKIKGEYIENYGLNEHDATVIIIKEIGVSAEVVKIVDAIDFLTIPDIPHLPIETQIAAYADCRVAPHGVLSLKERLEEGHKRYKKKETYSEDRQWENNKNIMIEIENKIFSRCKIKPEDITDEVVTPIIARLRDYVIK